jgi:uncharacterized protein
MHFKKRFNQYPVMETDMYEYFHRTKIDKQFYDEHIRHRLPYKIIDAHAHFNLPKHIAAVTQEEIKGDWALECGSLMIYEDACIYAKTMFPGKEWKYVMLPWPLKNADTVGNNEYIASLIRDHGEFGLFTVRPEYTPKYIETAYSDGGFYGFKPYPYMASEVKGANISIFDFMPREQFELANRLGAPVLLHLPRAGRLPDPDNVSEIRSILNDYPRIKLVVAHFGRCFNHEYFEKAFDLFGEDMQRLWFDCAAVMNPKVHEIAFARLDYRRILFGTDLPIFLWHGRREWDERGYHNLCREDFSWNTHKYPLQENGYTYFIYEQLNNILNVAGDDRQLLQAVFHDNAVSVYGK